jgi:hypothetical protein
MASAQLVNNHKNAFYDEKIIAQVWMVADTQAPSPLYLN